MKYDVLRYKYALDLIYECGDYVKGVFTWIDTHIVNASKKLMNENGELYSGNS